MKGTPHDLFTGQPHAEDDSARQTAAAVSQKKRVLQALKDAHPDPVSHAEICARIGANRASHRILELIREGWQIEGAGTLGLDPANQTQLYRLSSETPGKPRLKHVGMKVLWDEDGLSVSLHRDINGAIDRVTLEVLAGRVQQVIHDALGPRLSGEE
jgi:hypothetical protein